MAEQIPCPQARRSFITLAAAAFLVLTGCVPRGERPVPRPDPIPEEETRPIPLPGDQTRNRVAILVPLSGANAGVGQSIANAATLALLDTGGEAVRITVYDTAKGAATAATQALAEGNGLILGPLLAEDVEAVAPIARRRDVPIVSFSNDEGIAGNGVYIMGFTPAQSIERVVGYARSQGLQRFAGLIPDGVYGRRASQALIASVEGAGGRMVAMQSYDRSAASMNAAIGRLNTQSGFDAVLIADSGRIAMQAAPVISRGASARAKILGTELWNTETGLGSQAALRGAWFASPSDSRFNQLRTRYRARYKSNPYRLASLGYDAVLLAVRLSGKEWKIGRTFPASALRQSDGFTGVDGAIRFRKDGTSERQLEVKQVNAGASATVSPAAQGFGR
ncbi:MAG: penicillin-binding protein activator [Sphingosinicella sp.]|nr:penicillin-binding protein activator [Sphingosinicella sp.]